MVTDGASSSFAVAASTKAAQDAALEKDVVLLFDLWRAPLLGYISTLRLAIEDGEEVVQEVFLALFQHLRSGRSRENLRGWVFRVGHNLALKRRAALQRPFLQQPDGALDEVRDAAPNPEQMLAMKQRQARLLAVVSALPDQDRCCLHLRAEGFRYREIAEVLGISLGSVALSLGRSLERLRHADR
jgi:RNA polymerase sigma-70 factor (ECF subfamily)